MNAALPDRRSRADRPEPGGNRHVPGSAPAVDREPLGGWQAAGMFMLTVPVPGGTALP